MTFQEKEEVTGFSITRPQYILGIVFILAQKDTWYVRINILLFDALVFSCPHFIYKLFLWLGESILTFQNK